MPTSMKILCCCAGGNTRSVTLATLLKYHFGNHDALACSVEKNSVDTLKMLFDWSELVIAVDTEVLDYIKQYTTKAILINIGQDKWGMSMHPDLIPLACSLLDKAGFRSARTPEQIVAKRAKYDLRREQKDETSS